MWETDKLNRQEQVLKLLYVHITLLALTLDDFSISPNASLQNSSPPS